MQANLSFININIEVFQLCTKARQFPIRFMKKKLTKTALEVSNIPSQVSNVVDIFS